MNNEIEIPELCPSCRTGAAMVAAHHEDVEFYQVAIYCQRDQTLTVIERGQGCAPVVHTIGPLNMQAALAMAERLDVGEQAH